MMFLKHALLRVASLKLVIINTWFEIGWMINFVVCIRRYVGSA